MSSADEAWEKWDWDCETAAVTYEEPFEWAYAAFSAGFAAGKVAALTEAADEIQALHPGEVKNSVVWLRARAVEVGD